jgi:hypothetical protein
LFVVPLHVTDTVPDVPVGTGAVIRPPLTDEVTTLAAAATVAVTPATLPDDNVAEKNPAPAAATAMIRSLAAVPMDCDEKLYVVALDELPV